MLCCAVLYSTILDTAISHSSTYIYILLHTIVYYSSVSTHFRQSRLPFKSFSCTVPRRYRICEYQPTQNGLEHTFSKDCLCLCTCRKSSPTGSHFPNIEILSPKYHAYNGYTIVLDHTIVFGYLDPGSELSQEST